MEAINQLPEQQLDNELEQALAEMRLQRKRKVISQLICGELPSAIDLNEFYSCYSAPASAISSRESQLISSSANKLNFPDLEFRGTNYAALKSFIYELECRFAIARAEFADDLQRVVYAASALKGHIRTRWTTYVQTQHDGEICRITWPQMREWLRDSFAGPETRAISADRDMAALHQLETQTVRQFFDRYEAIEAEYEFTHDPVYNVVHPLNKLRTDIRQQIIQSNKLPTTRAGLINAAMRAESDIRLRTDASGPSAKQPRSGISHRSQSQGNATFSSGQEWGHAATPDTKTSSVRPATCYDCGRGGSPRIRMPRCNM